MRLRSTLLFASLWAAGCSGGIGDPLAPMPSTSPRPSTSPSPTTSPSPSMSPSPSPSMSPSPSPSPSNCDHSQYQGITLGVIEARFSQNVEPLLIDAATGCTACHGATSGRRLIISGDGRQDFYGAQAAGLLDRGGASMLARLSSTDEVIRMPKGLAAWSTDKVNFVADIVCALETYSTASQPDEIFPPNLVDPYTGPPVAEFDDNFINYPQLRGKVRSIFQDDWVRSGVDHFAENLGLFGGVDFMNRLVESRGATSDFLLALDALASDVCLKAATSTSGPFTGMDLSLPLADVPPSTTTRYEAENPNQMVASTGGVEGTVFDLYAEGNLTTHDPYPFPAPGDYRFTIRARGTPAAGLGPDMELRVNGQLLTTFTNIGTALTSEVFTATLPAGAGNVTLSFINDAYMNGEDRNLLVDYLTIEGPLGAGTGTTRQVAAEDKIKALYQKVLFRSASTAEVDAARQLLLDISAMGLSNTSAWSGVCEALVKHPDFLFTLPPSRDSQSTADQSRALILKVAQDLVARPPTAAEMDAFVLGQKTLDQVIDEYLGTTEFRDYFFYKMRIRTESHGSTAADEPGRMWTYLMSTGSPFFEALTGDYAVGTDFAKQTRAPEHGKTGILTMQGYLETKPGLPHFNYAARVLSDFMGYVFEVPPEVIAQRRNATPASTVDPTSICYSCHNLLTPLAHQRLAWKDDGSYRTVDDEGHAIDDTDRNLVAEYPYKGKGMEAFTLRAAKKERFIRTTLNMEYILLLGRPMRHDTDERAIYKNLWDEVERTQGDLRATLKAIMRSPAYQGH
ncbi:MAG: carbohydrate-binding domain-containing protein [Myxococcota bacterium]